MGYITEIRSELHKYSSKMNADEIMAWNEMMENPRTNKSDLESFLNKIKTK